MSNDQLRRLERAQRQYENLLMHAGDSLLLQEQQQGAVGIQHTGSGSPEKSPAQLNDTITPLRQSDHSGIENTPILSASATHSPHRELGDNNYHDAPLTGRTMGSTHSHDSLMNDSIFIPEKEKDNIILSLQDEVERLKSKLDATLTSVDGVIQEAQTAQQDIQIEYDRKIYDLNIRNSFLEDENLQLRVALELAQAQLDVEQENVRKSARYIERLKRRGREYTDAQRRSHSLILSTTGAFHQKHEDSNHGRDVTADKRKGTGSRATTTPTTTGNTQTPVSSSSSSTGKSKSAKSLGRTAAENNAATKASRNSSSDIYYNSINSNGLRSASNSRNSTPSRSIR